MASSLTATSIADSTHSNWSNSPFITPRKQPHCTKCKRPRAGHPRSGCPYVNASPSPSPTNPSSPQTSKKVPSEKMVEAMGSMHIASSPPRESEEDMKATVRNRRRKPQPAAVPLRPSESLVSLSTTSAELVEQLLLPGMFGKDTEPEDTLASGKGTRIVQWQETLRLATATPRHPSVKGGKFPARSPMPGTLITPGASFDYSSSSVAKQEIDPKMSINLTETSLLSTATVTPLPQGSGVKPLSRSMSLEQRQIFLSHLEDSAKATIYILSKADVIEIADAAHEVGFYANIVTNNDKDDNQALLVLGRDEIAVGKLLKKVQDAEELKKREEGQRLADITRVPKLATSALKAAAGGAVIGAVGTWAGLAFA